MILIKQHDAIQPAHLYEHLFCMAIDDLFWDRSLSPYLDYELSGRVLHKGIIYIDLALHTKPARRLAKRIPSLKIDLGQSAVIVAASQIIAEKERTFGSRGLEAMTEELRSIQEKPWHDIDALGLLDSKGIRRKPGAFYMAKGKPWPAKKVSVTVSLDREFAASHRELLPLFWQLANLISDNVMSELYDQYGFFRAKERRKHTRNDHYLAHDFKVPYGDQVDVPGLQKAVQEVVADLYQSQAYARLMADLRSSSHNLPNRLFPDPVAMFEKTGILVGAEGWRRIASDENCERLLRQMVIEVRHGRKRASGRLELPIVLTSEK